MNRLYVWIAIAFFALLALAYLWKGIPQDCCVERTTHVLRPGLRANSEAF